MNTVAASASLVNEDYKKRQAILDKPWAECSTEEKLEKVREELIQLGHMSWSISDLNSKLSSLMDHDHKDGKVVIPLQSKALGGSLSGVAKRRNNLA